MRGNRERVAPARRAGDHDGARRLTPALRAAELNAARRQRRLPVRSIAASTSHPAARSSGFARTYWLMMKAADVLAHDESARVVADPHGCCSRVHGLDIDRTLTCGTLEEERHAP